MNWDLEIEVEGKEGVKATLTVADIHNALFNSLTRDDVEEFAGELIKAAVLSPVDLGEEA